jgi:2-C-methyl-D-erythritol 2,4-cyclodiphosphate synthase/2-C-methyl-D-erythritol 4-phosphate cytidylyltransferase
MSSPIDVVIAAAGSGRRLARDRPKAFVEFGGRPMLLRSLEAAAAIGARRTVVTVPAADPDPWAEEVRAMAAGRPVVAVPGGPSRQASVFEGLKALRRLAAEAAQPAPATVLVHDAARPCASLDLWHRVADAVDAAGAAVPVLPSVDSLKRVDGAGGIVASVDRATIVRAQTPQGFRFDWLLEAHETAAAGGPEASDDAALLERLGRRVATVAGEAANIKVTTAADLAALARSSFLPAAAIRVGYGYDIHPLVEGRRLVLGGVQIEHDRGLMGHSDADSLAHAIADALLGAAGLGDIGKLFPAEDPRWAGADSLELLAKVVEQLAAAGYRPLNVDATILAERPRLAPHLETMGERLAKAMGIDAGAVNVKATRGEGMGVIGRGEGIAAHAVATVARG